MTAVIGGNAFPGAFFSPQAGLRERNVKPPFASNIPWDIFDWAVLRLCLLQNFVPCQISVQTILNHCSKQIPVFISIVLFYQLFKY